MSFFSKLFKKHPKNYSELKSLIEETIGRKVPFCDLNFIDVSKITNMSHLFEESVFDGDISRWDVSNVVTMYRMFRKSKFTGDISQWNVSNVVNMNDMFDGSDFKGDISGWSLNAQLCKPFTDLRDGEVYRTCRIGNQVWMAENLRYCCKNGGCFAPNGQSENICQVRKNGKS